jgi:hypothetical protein
MIGGIGLVDESLYVGGSTWMSFWRMSDVWKMGSKVVNILGGRKECLIVRGTTKTCEI